MKLRQPWMIRLIAFLAAVVLRFWTGTIRYRMILRDPRNYPGEPTFEGRYIYSLWHETLIGVAGRSWPAKIYMLVSQHADGELIARVAQHMGFGIVRGSSTRGGATALRELVDLGSRALLAVTPDGPRGPR